jgi:hypothetical protein
MNYVGIDWAYGRAAFLRDGRGRRDHGRGLISADEDGLAKLVLRLGTEARAAVEMMSGAVWVRDRLEASGWQVQIAHARKVRDVAPLACKTDKVDARVLAELRRRDLVPELWLPSPEDRALRERLRRRAHLVKARTSARNRIFGLLTQFGLRVSYRRLRKPDGIELLESHGVPAVWRASIAELLELSEEMDRRIDPIDRELRPPGAGGRASGPARDDPGGRPAAQPHPRRRDRRGLALSLAEKADRLRGPRPEGEPIGEALGDRIPLQGGLPDASLGRGRGGQPGLAPLEPMARPLPEGLGSPRKEPGEVGGRPQAFDRGLADARAPRALQACPGKLLRFLTARRSCMELRRRGSSQERSAPRAPKEK